MNFNFVMQTRQLDCKHFRQVFPVFILRSAHRHGRRHAMEQYTKRTQNIPLKWHQLDVYIVCVCSDDKQMNSFISAKSNVPRRILGGPHTHTATFQYTVPSPCHPEKRADSTQNTYYSSHVTNLLFGSHILTANSTRN